MIAQTQEELARKENISILLQTLRECHEIPMVEFNLLRISYDCDGCVEVSGIIVPENSTEPVTFFAEKRGDPENPESCLFLDACICVMTDAQEEIESFVNIEPYKLNDSVDIFVNKQTEEVYYVYSTIKQIEGETEITTIESAHTPYVFVRFQDGLIEGANLDCSDVDQLVDVGNIIRFMQWTTSC